MRPSQVCRHPRPLQQCPHPIYTGRQHHPFREAQSCASTAQSRLLPSAIRASEELLKPHTTRVMWKQEGKGGCDNLLWLHRIVSRSTDGRRSEEHTSELQSLRHLVCRLL